MKNLVNRYLVQMEAECGTGSPLHHQELCDLHIKCAQEAAGLFHQVNNNNQTTLMVVTGLYLHSSTLDIYTIMFTENMLLALAGKVLLEKNIMEVILASSCRGLQCHYGSIHSIKNLKNYTK